MKPPDVDDDAYPLRLHLIYVGGLPPSLLYYY